MDRFISSLDARRVMHMLSSNLDKERKMWKPIFIRPSCDQSITGQHRNEIATWLTHLAVEFKFLPETCGLAILLMDRVLQLVKVRSKYLQCVGVTCLYIAAKTLEEDENIPPTPDLVRKTRCGCSFAEITRMEMVILSKLNWDILMPSAIDFLHTIYIVLIMHYPHLLSNQTNMSPSEHLSRIIPKMIRCLTCHAVLRYKPSTIALTLISLELEQITPGWLRLILALQRMTNVGSEQLMQCREVMANILGHHVHSKCTHKSPDSSSFAPQSKRRKVEHVQETETEDENMYDGLRRLYSDDSHGLKTSTGNSQTDKLSRRTSCSLEMHQDCEDNTKSLSLSGQTLLVN
uniref:Cyclin-like domain-containing protein n=1 Tax=Arion vulgaris TaxID=1028688 RepID=A0A0B6YF69_9EUPU